MGTEPPTADESLSIETTDRWRLAGTSIGRHLGRLATPQRLPRKKFTKKTNKQTKKNAIPSSDAIKDVVKYRYGYLNLFFLTV